MFSDKYRTHRLLRFWFPVEKISMAHQNILEAFVRQYLHIIPDHSTLIACKAKGTSLNAYNQNRVGGITDIWKSDTRFT